MQDAAIHIRELSTTRCVPPAGFGYPLDGFLSPRPGRPLFQAGSAPGIPSSEPDRQPGGEAVSRPGRTRTPFAETYIRTQGANRPSQPRPPGFHPNCPFRDPPGVISATDETGSSLEVHPLQGTPTAFAAHGFPHTRLSHGSAERDKPADPPPQSLTTTIRAQPDRHRSAAGSDRPSWGSRTSTRLDTRTPKTPGLLASPHAAPSIAVRPAGDLEKPRAFYRSCRGRPLAPSLSRLLRRNRKITRKKSEAKEINSLSLSRQVRPNRCRPRGPPQSARRPVRWFIQWSVDSERQ
jgi:hypothetical protein